MDECRDSPLNKNLINKISSIKPRTNDINNIDKQSNRINTINFDRLDYNNKYSTNNLERDEMFIYPGSFTATTYMNLNSIHPPRMFGPPTPQKQIPRIDLNALGTSCNQPGFDVFGSSRSHNPNSLLPTANSYSNFPVINKGSFISKSTHYSSNNKNKQGNLDPDTSQDLVDISINDE